MLLRTLEPELHAGEYVFALAPDGAVPAGVEPIATVREEEGLTLVLARAQAAVHHDHVFVPLRHGEQARAVLADLG